MADFSGNMSDHAPDVVRTELLIVGAGPAGASLACFLGEYGRSGIMIASAPGTAETPRAHITNMAGLECLRDIGLEEQCVNAATHGDNMTHTRWCHTMAGEEYARIYSWGNDPDRKGSYAAASPCRHVDLPQTELEPILTRRALGRGWTIRFDTSLLSFERHSPDVIISTVRDAVLNATYKIQSRFLFGCDGARSQVVRELEIPFIKQPRQGLALNLLVRADLAHLVANRMGNLHWILLPEKRHPVWGWAALLRLVRPWNEWMFIFLPAPGADVTSDQMDATHEEYLARVHEMIGDPSVKAEILNVSKWWINEMVAEYYSKGNVYCMGDAVHRHPPFNGLGSNTCIQDAYNLAWKIDYVISGKAGPRLLDTFNEERQPVGQAIVARANQGLRDHNLWMETIGMLQPDVEQRKQILAEFDDPGEKGRKRRQAFQKGIENTATEFHGLGIEMNQLYSSSAVYLLDETAGPPQVVHKVFDYAISTYPGKRLPHAWLNTRVPGRKISTQDIAGHGSFCLLTGPGGEAWKSAAWQASERLRVPINSYCIGWKGDYEDVYFDWARRREVAEDGCVLVRPDRFVAWRCPNLIRDHAEKLEEVLKSVLDR